MDELYVYVIMSVADYRISSEKLGMGQSNYVFAPLGGNQIFTIDEEVWKAAGQHKESIYFPNEIEFNTVLHNSMESHSVVLAGLVDRSELYIPGSGLTKLEIFNVRGRYRSIDAGYDVVDSFGLSAVCNVGYSKDESAEIDNLTLSISKFGLLDTKADSCRFSSYADKHVEEHAPFLPVRVVLFLSDEFDTAASAIPGDQL